MATIKNNHKAYRCDEVIDIQNKFQEGLKMVHQNPKHALEISNDLLEMYQERMKDNLAIKSQAYGKVLLGGIENSKGNYGQAILYINDAVEAAKNIKDWNLLSAACHSLGNSYGKSGNLQEALEIYIEGLEAAKKIESPYEINLLNNISVVYSKMEKYDQALSFLKEAYNKSKGQSPAFQGFLLSNIAEVYFKLEDLNNALDYNLRAWDLLEKTQDVILYKLQCYKTFAKVYGRLGRDEKALSAYEDGVALCQTINDQYRLCSLYSARGNFHFDRNDYHQAIEYFNKAYDMGIDLKADVEIRDNSYLLSLSHEHIQDYEKALMYMRIYHDYNDKIKTETLERNMENRALLFKMNQAKQEIAHEKDKSRMVKETLKALHSLAEIGQILTATLDEDQVLDLIYDHTQGLIDADVLGVCHYDEGSQTIDYRRLVQQSQPQALKQISIHDPKSLAARCIRERRTIFYDNLDHESMKSVIYTPLMVFDQVVGAFTIQKAEAFHYSNKTLEIVSTLAAFVAIALKNSKQSMALEEKSKALEILSRTDTLTKLYNRRYMLEKLKEEYERSFRNNSNFCLALIDIDLFKNINDTYGHGGGDLVLAQVSEFLEKSLRPYDLIARWGGEEFLIMFPETSLDQGRSLCQRIRSGVESLSFDYQGTSIGITISMGVSKFDSKKSLETIIQEADRCLYKGKDRGRNCVVTINDF